MKYDIDKNKIGCHNCYNSFLIKDSMEICTKCSDDSVYKNINNSEWYPVDIILQRYQFNIEFTDKLSKLEDLMDSCIYDLSEIYHRFDEFILAAYLFCIITPDEYEKYQNKINEIFKKNQL